MQKCGIFRLKVSKRSQKKIMSRSKIFVPVMGYSAFVRKFCVYGRKEYADSINLLNLSLMRYGEILSP